MKAELIDKPIDYLNSFSLHDVRIENIKIDVNAKTMEIAVVDLNWNYEGSGGYLSRPCSIVFRGAIAYFIDILDLEGIRIDHNLARLVDGLAHVDIHLNAGGGDLSWERRRSSISIKFESMEIRDRL